MDFVLNLDITNGRKTTDLGIRANTPNSILFGIYDGEYYVDYAKLNSISIKLKSQSNNTELNYNITSFDIVSINNNLYVKWNIPTNINSIIGKYSVSIIVRYDNVNYAITDFKFIVHDSNESEMRAISQAISNFNKNISEYLNYIKRSDIDKENGVIMLDSLGRIDKKYIPGNLDSHIKETLYDTRNNLEQLHGMRINKDDYQMEYYDSDDEAWYRVNSIFGGLFDKENKSEEYNIFGGNFTDPEPPEETNIFGGNFLG